MTHPKPTKAVLTTLVFAALGHFVMDLSLGTWTVYKTMAGLDLALAGIIAGLCPFIGEGMQLIFGTLGDKGYRKPLLLFGLAAGAANFFLPYANHYFFLFLIYLLTCLGSGAFHPTGVAVASGLTKEHKGLFVTIFASVGALGLALSQIVFFSLFKHFNGQTSYLAILPLALILFQLFNPEAINVTAPTAKRYGFSALKQIFRSHEMVTLYIAQVFNQAIFWGFVFLLPDILASKGYSPWLVYGGGHLIFILGGAIMMVIGGYMSDKYSSKNILLASIGLGCLFFNLFLFIPSTLPTGTLLSLLFVLGSCLGVACPITVAYGHKLFPSRPGLVSGILMGMVWCVAEGLGPSAAGLLTKCFVEDAPIKALSFFGIFFIFSAIVTVFLPKEISPEMDLEAA